VEKVAEVEGVEVDGLAMASLGMVVVVLVAPARLVSRAVRRREDLSCILGGLVWFGFVGSVGLAQLVWIKDWLGWLFFVEIEAKEEKEDKKRGRLAHL
jgi:hypothetical protein